MAVYQTKLSFKTKGNTDIVDITSKVQDALVRSKIKKGNVYLFVVGSTAGLTTCEYEPGLIKDLKKMFDEIIPQREEWRHNSSWGGSDGNAHAHLRASLLGADLNVPFEDGKLLLGTWQQVILIDFDNRPRSREIIFSASGD